MQRNSGCFQTLVLEKTLENPLDSKKIKPEGNQPWIFIGRTDAEAETPILWTPDGKNCLIWKDPDAGNNWRWQEKGTAEDEMIGWHHQLKVMTWVWTISGSWWWTEKPGVLQSMGSQRVGHSWETELNWAEPRVTVTQLSHSKMIVLITHPRSFPLEAQSSNIYVLTHSLELDMEQQTGSK